MYIVTDFMMIFSTYVYVAFCDSWGTLRTSRLMIYECALYSVMRFIGSVGLDGSCLPFYMEEINLFITLLLLTITVGFWVVAVVVVVLVVNVSAVLSMMVVHCGPKPIQNIA